MERVKSNSNHLLALLSIPIINVCYQLLNNNHRGVFTIITGIDRNIPFIKAFIIPYLLWYPYVFLVLMYLCMNDLNTYYKTIISIDIGLVVCYVAYN